MIHRASVESTDRENVVVRDLRERVRKLELKNRDLSAALDQALDGWAGLSDDDAELARIETLRPR